MRGRRVDLYQSKDYNENNGLKSCIATCCNMHSIKHKSNNTYTALSNTHLGTVYKISSFDIAYW